MCVWGGGGVGGTNFQLLILSLDFLKSKIPMSRWGGGGWWNQLSTFDAESKFAKIQNSHVRGGGGGGGWWNQLSTFDAESKFANKNFFFAKIFFKFSDKKHNGFVLDFEYQVAPLYEV